MGGMVANNSGGEKTLRYGKTVDYIEELEVVLSDGQAYSFGELNEAGLGKKLRQQDFEGGIYRRMHELIIGNEALIEGARPKVSKNSSGYYLWEVWDRERGSFNLAKLICGSQGSLGIITRVKLRLIHPKPHSRMLVALLKDLSPLGELIPAVLRHKPESFESYDDHTLKLALRYLPELVGQMRGSFFGLLWDFLPELRLALTAGYPKLVLMAEFTGESLHEVNEQARLAQDDLAQRFPGLKSLVTHSRKESGKYWIVRRESFNLLRKHLRHKHTAPFIDDICVRPETLTEFLPKLTELMSRYELIYTIAGHIGDGNFHIIPLMDLSDPRQRAIIPELERQVYDLVFRYGGSMSGEHNDGLIRTPYLRQMFGAEVYKLFEETKRIFDPEGIFNPGKKVGGSTKESMRHMIRD